MSEYLTTTQSICRVCRKLLPAQVVIENGAVWFRKHCPEHGAQTARISSDPQAYLRLSRFQRPASTPLVFAATARGCPDSCGLCPEHEQHVCLPILEITDHCNWDCPICLVRNPGTYHRTRAEAVLILDSLVRSEGQVDVLNLSGGEPTLNPYFREIIEECAARKEIVRVSVSTNGSVLVHDPELLRFLAERRVIVSLQFDGLNDDIYQALRGRPVLSEKLRLIDLCAEFNIPMSLTATVVQGVNDHRLAEIGDLLFQHEHILSAMFQPAAYAGNAARMERPSEAVTIPDVIAALKGAGDGAVSPEDFSPLPCSHPACFALAFYLKTEDKCYISIKQMVNPERYLGLIQNRAIFGTDAASFSEITDAAYDLWAGLPPPPKEQDALAPTDSCAAGLPCACNPYLSEKALKAMRNLLISATSQGGYSPKRAMEIGERSVKSIFIHQFMDSDTFDLSRARKCCQVYPQSDGRLIPACVYNCLKRERL